MVSFNYAQCEWSEGAISTKCHATERNAGEAIMLIEEVIPVNQQNSMLFNPSLKTNVHEQLANHH